MTVNSPPKQINQYPARAPRFWHGMAIGDWFRLLSRNRFRLPRLRDRIGMLPMEPGSLVMERKMLRGIKQRAESLAARESLRNA